MAKLSLDTLKSYFTTGSKPTQTQFWAWLDSFFHKDDNIPVTQIDGLQAELDKKIDKDSISISDVSGLDNELSIVVKTTSQSLTESEKSQSRTNIMAAYSADVLYLSHRVDLIQDGYFGGSANNYIIIKNIANMIDRGNQLLSAYDAAKLRTDLSENNQFTIICYPGRYLLDRVLSIDTDWINIVSLTGECDIELQRYTSEYDNAQTPEVVIVSAENCHVKGVNLIGIASTIGYYGNYYANDNYISASDYYGTTVISKGVFTVTSTFKGIIEKCKSGGKSFGYNIGSLYGTFIDVEAEDESFGYNCYTYAIFIRCTGRDKCYSYGKPFNGQIIDCIGRNYCIAYHASMQGLIHNFTGGDNCISVSNNINGIVRNSNIGDNGYAHSGYLYGSMSNCSGGEACVYSVVPGGFINHCIFSSGLNSINGKVLFTTLTDGTFGNTTLLGITRYCVDGNGATNNQN
ncbi:MAG: hypothetical protein PHH37_08260 [Paludibacter sp.]|nr:hypothetical protein [Paludibacter sp.]